jgi:[acyl-carrier-protein] S-malonyltransferase
MSQTALLFAGQGAQYVGMGKALAEEFPIGKDLFEQANQILGYDLRQICFEGPAEELLKTEHAQPGIFLVSWVAHEVLRHELPALCANATAGLSLGEFTALTASGALSFEEGLKLTRQRGLFMQEACDQTPGAMAAVIGLDLDRTRIVCNDAGVEIANLNCPGQIVISGDKEGIAQACEAAKSKGAKRALPLEVAGAYHSKLMSGAQEKLAESMKSVPIGEMKLPVYSNVTGAVHKEGEELSRNLVRQVTSSVLWEQSIRNLLEQGVDTFIELGPGKALTGFMRRIDKSATVTNVEDPKSLVSAIELLSGR